MDIYINKSMVSHEHIQKYNINDSFKTIYILIFLRKIFCIEKKFILKFFFKWEKNEQKITLKIYLH
jgi:hypothetical protein